MPWEPKNNSVERREEKNIDIIEITLIIYVPQLRAIHMHMGLI
jgi:hypothetical protein